ncbi:Ca2+-binding RTX toxin-like protein [Paenibacillus mucilaginosus]|uniref:calcium-binding protein n=1 Tax=Paenibacillus mucilaginosus TaxID=61624 RepID=UPI003D25CF3E
MEQELQKPRLVFGTKGNDVLTASRSGEDHIFAGAGEDYLLAAPGSSSHVLHGGDGEDTFLAEGDSHVLYGETGDDTITVVSNGSRIHGNEGDDELTVSGSELLVTGGLGEDRIEAALDRSAVHSGAGDDYVDYGDTVMNRSTFDLGDGRDELRIRGEHNQAIGGTGEDSLFILAGSGNRIDGGADTDFLGTFGAVGSTLIGGYGDDWFSVGSDEYGSYHSRSNLYSGGGGNDKFAAGGSEETFLGGTGNDTLRAYYGSILSHSVLKGEAGSDTLLLDDPSGTSFNLLDGGDGNDSLTATHASNLLKGGSGNDELALHGWETRGNTLSGGRGSDTYRIGEGALLNTIRDEGLSGETDRVIFEAVSAPEVTVNRQGNDLGLFSEAEKLLVQDFFGGAGQRVERFEFADGTIWTDKQVETLIQAMAAGGSSAGSADGESSLHAPAELSLLLMGTGTPQV